MRWQPIGATKTALSPQLGQALTLLGIFTLVGLPQLTTVANVVILPLALALQLPSVKPKLVHGLFLILLLWCFATSQWSADAGLSDRFSMRLAFSAICVFSIIVATNSPKGFTLFLGSVAAGQGALLLQFFHENGLASNADGMRASITGINANYFAYSIAASSVATLALIPRLRRRGSQMACFIVLSFAVWALVVSGSRGAELSMGVMLAWSVVPLRARKHVGKLLPLMIPLQAIIALSGVLDEHLRPTTTSVRETGDLNGRLTLWPLAREVFHSHPLRGVGVGSFELASGSSVLPHNAYLTWAAESGIVGLALFTCLVTHMLSRPAWKRGRVPFEAGAVILMNLPLLYSGVWDRSPVFWITLALGLQVSAGHTFEGRSRSRAHNDDLARSLQHKNEDRVRRHSQTSHSSRPSLLETP